MKRENSSIHKSAVSSIRSRLILIIFATTALGLFLSAIGLVYIERKLTRQSMVSNLQVLAGVIGWHSRAALTFNDPKAALDALEALRANRHIEVAYIIDAGGRIFASYNRSDTKVPAAPETSDDDGYWFADGRLSLYQSISLNEKKIGRIYIQSDTRELSTRLTNQLRDTAVSVVAALVITFLLSTRLQSAITGPISQLAKVTSEISHNKNYSLRAKKVRNDELGTLVDSFNAMLAEIQLRDSDLELARRELEGRVAALNREMAEREQAEKALAMQTRELERSNAELEQFAYVASHDLQEPLRAIAGCIQILKTEYANQLDADAEELISHTVAGAHRMKTLINDLLSYSRVGTRGKEFERVETQTIITNVLQNLAVVIKEKNADIQVRELPLVMADSTQLIQLFQNLIANALKFCCNQTPHVTISATRISENGAVLSKSESMEEREFWQFSFRDNGIGIEHQYAERIFIIFQRLHGREEYEGTGIGLSVCKKIVERHGGRIWMESELGKGSTFHFTMPVVEHTL